MTVLVNGDTALEANETFFVNLSGASGAAISDAQGQGTITNDDAARGCTDLPDVARACQRELHDDGECGQLGHGLGGAVPAGRAESSRGSEQWKYVPLPRPATVTMTAPGTAGTYELRLLANDSYTTIGFVHVGRSVRAHAGR